MPMSKQTRNTMKPPAQTQSPPVSSSLVFEGVYNNARMLHFLTAVVGSTCDVRVKNGAVYEGIFKTLSSQCELAVDAVHKRSDGDGGGGGEEGGGGGGGAPSSAPKIEEITDTMIFSPSDLVTMTCRDVDLTFAVRDTFTDSSIGSSRVNGDHREKVLQRWDGGGNGENFELESDNSNGWDASEMFRLNEEAYGIKSTYDSSLSMYTMPLERGSSEVYRQREARAARLASEIEGGVLYRQRVSLENDEGRSEEEKYSSVVREREEQRAREGFSSSVRDGKYVPRAREGGPSGGGVRPGGSGQSAAPSSSRHLPPPGPSSPHPPQSSPPCTNHILPHAPGSRSSVNGVALRTSPKSQRLQRNLRPMNCQSSPAVTRPPKPEAPPPDLPLPVPAYLDSSPSPASKPSDPTPLFPVDVNEILAAKERAESLSAPQEVKSGKAHTVQQRSQLDELRKFGKEFRLQPSFSCSAPPPPSSSPSSSSSSSSPSSSSSSSSSPAPPKPVAPPTTEAAPPSTAALNLLPGPQASGPEGPQVGGALPPPRSAEDSGEPAETAAAQVKNSTLNPNAKEFLPIKGNSATKPATTPTPRPTPPSPSVLLPSPGPQGGGCALYSSPPGHYLSYMSPITIQGHSLQAPPMYQYAMSAVNQGKYPRPKAPLVGPPRPDHHASSSSLMSAAASAAGPPLVASPYPLSYLQYGQVIQAMAPYHHGQTVYSMLQGGGARMLTSGAPPQQMGPGPQFPGQADAQQGPQQALYAPQSFSHHSSSMLRPQPPSTPTGNPPQHSSPSPGLSHGLGGGPQPQSMFHSAALAAPQGHAPPQASYAMQGFSLPGHGFPPLGQLTQAHVTGGMSGPHHSAGHGPPPLMLHYAPPQQGSSPNPQHGPPTQQGAPQHFYIGPAQALQLQAHPTQQLSFHPSTN